MAVAPPRAVAESGGRGGGDRRLRYHPAVHQHARHIVEPWPDYKSRVEYRVTDWLWKNMPDARVLPSGTVRFWFDAWHDLAEMGGGSEQGLLNPMVHDSKWEIDAGTNPSSPCSG